MSCDSWDHLIALECDAFNCNCGKRTAIACKLPFRPRRPRKRRMVKSVKRVDWSRTFEAFPFDKDTVLIDPLFSFLCYCEQLGIHSPYTTPPSDGGWHR